MLVYGDGTRLEAAREKLAEIARGIEAAWRGTAGLARHADLVAIFIAAGELAQGVSDAAMKTATSSACLARPAVPRHAASMPRAISASFSPAASSRVPSP